MEYVTKVDGGKHVRLADVDPAEHHGLERDKAEADAGKLGLEMSELLDLLFEAGEHSLLIVLQGRDTSGKDGMIRHLLSYTNAQSCRVIPFKVPTEEERDHDFLWRIHKETPGHGSIAIFNRSHYEDVLVVRVHKIISDSVCRRRYEHIKRFEELLLDSSTIVLKFYLHISKDEQERRLLERENETEKAWKLAVGDWKERELWDMYTEAYEDALNHCGTERAPWHIVPANHKWYRNLAVTHTIVDALKPYQQGWLDKLTEIGKTAKAELKAYRSGQNDT